MPASPKVDKVRIKTSKQQEKRLGKKNELADSAIEVLSQLGYAKTSLRDIAQHSGVSLGVVHYYFKDRIDLINYCTRRYKDEFAQMLEVVLLTGGSAEHVVEGLINGLANAIENNADKHRLWYDIRAQALFDESFQETVDEIEQLQINMMSALLGLLDVRNVDPLSVYLSVDGIFRHYLHRYLRNAPNTLVEFRQALREAIERITVATNSR